MGPALLIDRVVLSGMTNSRRYFAPGSLSYYEKINIQNGLSLGNGIWRDSQRLLTRHLSLVQRLQGIAEIVARQFEVGSCVIYLVEGNRGFVARKA